METPKSTDTLTYKTLPTNCSSIFLTSLLKISTSFQQSKLCRSLSRKQLITPSLACSTSFGKSFSTFLSPRAFFSFSISSVTFLLLASLRFFSSSDSLLKRSLGDKDGSLLEPDEEDESFEESDVSDVILLRAASRREDCSSCRRFSSAATRCWMWRSSDF